MAPALRLLKFLHQNGNCGGGGDLAQVHAAHAIGDHKEISVGARLVARSRDERSHGVFVVRAYFAGIACLAKHHIQHATGRLDWCPRNGSSFVG